VAWIQATGLRRLAAAAACAGAASALLACGQRAAPTAAPGPVVLITLDSLRADVIGGLGGEPGLAPNLESLAREADWAGTAVAASSWGVPAMASLFTGLQPWQHQAILDTQARLSPDLLTLPRAMKALGYQTAGFTSGSWYTPENGYARGFDSFEDLGKGWQASEQLSALVDGRQFVWLHIPEPQAPYVRRAWLLPRLGGGEAKPGAASPAYLPRSIEPLQLEAHYDPAAPLPAADRPLFWALYRLNVAWADERLGRLLEALRASGQWRHTLLVVTANQGEAFGEHGQLGHGGNLGREALEVPLIVKLPAGSPRLAVPRGGRVAATRLWATLVEGAGGSAPPALAPSLFRRAGSEILSELYGGNGTNQFSLLAGDLQLLWEARFAPPEPAYYRARFQLLSAAPESAPGEPPRLPFPRLAEAFAGTPPLAGDGRPRLWLERWEARGSRPVPDGGRTAALARRLSALWNLHAGEACTPAAEARLRMVPAGDQRR
jgi:arylsulfatase A-like enzyme